MFEKKISVYNEVKVNQVKKTVKQLLVYMKKIQAKTFSSVRLLATPGDCKRLLVLLATPDNSWSCLHPRCPSCS